MKAFKELRTAVAEQQLVAGRMALKEFSDAERELATLGEKLPIEALKHELDIVQAKAQLEDMEAREQAFKDLEHGRKHLKVTLAARDSAATRKAIEAVGMAEMILRDLHQDFPCDGGLMTDAIVQLDIMVAEEQAAARRLAATERLAEAVASRSPQRCADALVEAHDAGLEPTPTAQLAEILANPSGLCEALASEAAGVGAAAAELRKSFGVTVDDFAEAAKATAAGMDEEQLRGQAALLVAAILRNHALHSEYLEQHLSGAQATLQERCLNRVEVSMAKFNRERDAAEAAKRMELEETFRKKTEASIEEVTAKVAKEGEAARDALHQEAMKVIGDRVLIERGAIEERLLSLGLPVEALNDLLRTGQSLQQRSHASTGLAAAMLSLQSAFKEGRPLEGDLRALRTASAGEDDSGFARRLVQRLPEATIARSASAVPTEPQLQLSFNKQLHGFKAAALTPPSAGPFMDIASRLAGGALAHLYGLRTPLCGAFEEGSATEAARRNLALLSRAVPLVEAGDLRGALTALEGLTGACHASAKSWMEDARHALLLQQAMAAMQAKAQCLNASLS